MFRCDGGRGGRGSIFSPMFERRMRGFYLLNKNYSMVVSSNKYIVGYAYGKLLSTGTGMLNISELYRNAWIKQMA